MALQALNAGQGDQVAVTPKTPYPGPQGSAATANPNPLGGANTPTPVVEHAQGDTAGAGQTTVQPTPPPDSIVTTQGFDPNYTAAIQNDPAYAQAQTNAQQAQAQAEAQRKAAIQSAVIQYGGLGNYKDAYGDIDQATLDAANANQYSTMAGLNRNYQQSVDQFRKALAARGALQSGDLNYGQDQLDTGYGQNLYDSANAFGSTAQGAINNYTGVLGQNNANLVSAISSAESNAYADPANRPVAQKTAALDQGKTSLYGQPIYSDPDTGVLYKQDGSVFDPSQLAAVKPNGIPANTYVPPGFQGFDAQGNWVGFA